MILTQPIIVQTTVFESEFVTETWEEGKMPELEYADYEEGMKGIKWIASYVEGKKATVTEEYVITYDQNGNLISKTPILIPNPSTGISFVWSIPDRFFASYI